MYLGTARYDYRKIGVGPDPKMVPVSTILTPGPKGLKTVLLSVSRTCCLRESSMEMPPIPECFWFLCDWENWSGLTRAGERRKELGPHQGLVESGSKRFVLPSDRSSENYSLTWKRENSTSVKGSQWQLCLLECLEFQCPAHHPRAARTSEQQPLGSSTPSQSSTSPSLPVHTLKTDPFSSPCSSPCLVTVLSPLLLTAPQPVRQYLPFLFSQLTNPRQHTQFYIWSCQPTAASLLLSSQPSILRQLCPLFINTVNPHPTPLPRAHT